MISPIAVNIAVEDELSEMVLRKILQRSERSYVVGQCFRQNGFGYLKKKIAGFNNAAKGIPFIVLTDLDQSPCPASLIATWLPVPRHNNLIFRVAVREIEAWLLADRQGLAAFLNISEANIPPDPESVNDPKAALIKAAEKSRSRVIREDLIPQKGTTGKQGPNYNGQLCDFVVNHWNVPAAANVATHLKRTLNRLSQFVPIIP